MTPLHPHLEKMTSEIMGAIKRAAPAAGADGKRLEAMIIAATFTHGALATELHKGCGLPKPECFDAAVHSFLARQKRHWQTADRTAIG